MMGAGKSSVGRALADLSEREFLDTDLMLQNRLGRPIPQIFQVYGEDCFRDHETSLLRSLEPSASILSTGGGIVLREENWVEMRRLGITIFLDTPDEILIQRLEQSKKRRPLLEAEDWKDRVQKILSFRRPLYERADVRVPIVDEDIEHAATRVLNAIRQALP